MSGDPSSKSWLERLGQILTREPKDREELIEVLQEAGERQVITADALRMIEGVLEVFDMQVRDIMIPRSQMVVVEHDDSLEKILPIVIASAHSRFPVIGESRDEVVGILLAKDLLRYSVTDKESFNVQAVLRPAAFIPESKRLNTLLEEFRLKRNHIALVVDEYGGVSGMVTIEDVLEQIVGEIEDEYDIDENQTDITQLNDSQYTVKALTTIKDFNHFFKTQFSDEEFNTVGGLVTKHFAHLPKRDECTLINGLHFKVLHADRRRIRLLRVTVTKEKP
jgi:magnesium and cobalt transporter